MTNYNLTEFNNATTYSGLFKATNNLSGGLYSISFLIIIFLFIVIGVPTTIPKKFVIGSFVNTFISSIMFITGVISINAVIVFGSLMFISVVWAMND